MGGDPAQVRSRRPLGSIVITKEGVITLNSECSPKGPTTGIYQLLTVTS